METNNDTPISDAVRAQAETKKLVLTPLHTDIVPEPLPESETIARSSNAPLIANIPSDTEHEDTVLQPSRGIAGTSEEIEVNRSATKYIAGTFIALTVSAVAVVYVIIK